jgi:Uncharacterised methyltransferase family (DUF6094)
MARLASTARAGFYPAAPEAIEAITGYLDPPREPFTILDPCAGEGTAIKQLADLLHCQPQNIYAVELAENRAETLKSALYEDSKVLAPASFFGIRASLRSFSCCYVNPPFMSAMSGGRVETDFLRRGTDLLVPGGVMVLVVPESQVGPYSDICGVLKEHYHNISVMAFPDGARPYDEVAVFGIKRLKPAERHIVHWEDVQAPAGFRYRIPAGQGPNVFIKVEPTESELEAALAVSPLRANWTAKEERKVLSPPLALNVGHTALLLASGMLDGIVHANGSTHVVRGTAKKRQYLASVTETGNADGSTTVKKVYSQKIDLVVKTVNASGTVRTFQNDPEVEDPAADDDNEGD